MYKTQSSSIINVMTEAAAYSMFWTILSHSAGYGSFSSTAPKFCFVSYLWRWFACSHPKWLI